MLGITGTNIINTAPETLAAFYLLNYYISVLFHFQVYHIRNIVLTNIPKGYTILLPYHIYYTTLKNLYINFVLNLTHIHP